MQRCTFSTRKEEAATKGHAGRKIPKKSKASQAHICIPVYTVALSLHFALALDGPRHVGLNFSNFNFRLFLSKLLGYSFACAIKQRPRSYGSTNLVSTWCSYHDGCLLSRQAPSTPVTLIEFTALVLQLIRYHPCKVDNATFYFLICTISAHVI